MLLDTATIGAEDVAFQNTSYRARDSLRKKRGVSIDKEAESVPPILLASVSVP